MPDIKSNEREFMSRLVTWLNEIIAAGEYPFEVASSEASLKTETSTTFPDVQIWIKREGKIGFCGFELKTPSTLSDNKELLENAAAKARAMEANYFVTWNMNDAVIWRTPNANERVTTIFRMKAFATEPPLTSPDELWPRSEALKSVAKKILDDLSTLHSEGHLYLLDVDRNFFVGKLWETVARLKPDMRTSLLEEIGKNRKFEAELSNWAARQGITIFDKGEPFYNTVSSQIVYRLLGKILFYLTLRRFRSDLPQFDLVNLNPNKISERLNEYFYHARQIDYQAIFEEEFTDKVPIPPSAAKEIIQLVADLNKYNFSHMPYDVIGSIFERLIPPEERHMLGQYYTNEDLVDLITAFCVRSKSDKVLDPTCGTGAFLIRAYDLLKQLGERNHRKLLEQIWGVDIGRFPAQLATMNLYRQKIEDYANFPRLIRADFFDVKPGGVIEFPHPLISNEKVKETIPSFDAIIGNFPFIRQEAIEKKEPGNKKKITKILADEWKNEYPELFNNGDTRLSGQADIYSYLFFHASRFLANEGRMGIITSNSWLDAAFGYELQKFFLKKFKLVAIVESRCEPWFLDAKVNTVFTVLERVSDDDKREREDNLVRFAQIKKPLEKLIEKDVKFSADRWFKLRNIVINIERSCADVADKSQNESQIYCEENDNYKVRCVRQSVLLQEAEKEGRTVKWGKYLRAPALFFEIMNEFKGKFLPLREAADVRFGVKPGITKFFLLTEDQINHWQIENQFLAPVIRSPKECNGINIDTTNLKHKLLICDDELKSLAKYRGVYSYIKWGKKQMTADGVPWPEAPSVKGRHLWYNLGTREPADGLWPEMYFDSFRVLLNTPKVYESDKFYGITSKEPKNAALIIALLNSALINLQRELIGFHSLGEGVTKAAVYEVEQLQIPDFRQFDKKTIKNILSLFKKLLKRPVKPIYEEVKMKDRREFDAAILDALGLDSSKYLNVLYASIVDLVRERVALAKMGGKIKTAVTQRDYEKLKEQITDEVLANGLKKFPKAFIDLKYLKEAKSVGVPKEKLRLGADFWGKTEIFTEEGFKYEADGKIEAKFIIYSQEKNSLIVLVPKNKIAIKNAVIEYEKYLDETEAKLFKAFFFRTNDSARSDMLAKQVMAELEIQKI